ncbi:MAG TPA: urease accessory protein UreE [Bacillota bacterium]|nr:urease accessory protein UreE [Bacillota bacterium]
MIINQVLGNLRDMPLAVNIVERVALEWHELGKRILRKTTDRGTEVGIALNGHGHLRNGDILFSDANRAIIVELLPSEVIVIEPRNLTEMAHVAYQLGNRHAQLFLEADQVLVPIDPTLVELFNKLGIPISVERRRLEHGLTPAGGHHH